MIEINPDRINELKQIEFSMVSGRSRNLLIPSKSLQELKQRSLEALDALNASKSLAILVKRGQRDCQLFQYAKISSDLLREIDRKFIFIIFVAGCRYHERTEGSSCILAGFPVDRRLSPLASPSLRTTTR